MTASTVAPLPAIADFHFFDSDGDNVARVCLPIYSAEGDAYAPSDFDLACMIVDAEGVKYDRGRTAEATVTTTTQRDTRAAHWHFHRVAVPYSMHIGNREVILPVGTLVQLHQMDPSLQDYPGSQFLQYGAVVRPVVSVPALDEWDGIYYAERGEPGDLDRFAPVLVRDGRVPQCGLTRENVAAFLLQLEQRGLGFHLDEDPATFGNSRGPMLTPTEIPALREEQRQLWHVARTLDFCPHDLHLDVIKGVGGTPSPFIHQV